MRSVQDLIIFDCDGVLVDSEVLAVKALKQVLDQAGVPANEAMIGRYFGMKQADILVRIAHETGVAIPPDVPKQIWPATRAWFERGLKAMPGVERFLVALGERPRCVASSSGVERIRLSLALTGLDRFFGDDIFSAQQVANGKPAPDLFLFAAENMLTTPDRAVVVEDSVYGVQGAGAAGMRAFGFLGGSHIEPGHGDQLMRAGAVAVETSWEGLAKHLLRAT